MDPQARSPALLLALLQADMRCSDTFLMPADLMQTCSMAGPAAVAGGTSPGVAWLLTHSPGIHWAEIGATPDTDAKCTVFPEAFLSAPQLDTESQPLRVLLVEDSPTDARLLQEMLAASTTELFQITHVGRLMEALQQLATERFDAVLL